MFGGAILRSVTGIFTYILKNFLWFSYRWIYHIYLHESYGLYSTNNTVVCERKIVYLCTFLLVAPSLLRKTPCPWGLWASLVAFAWASAESSSATPARRRAKSNCWRGNFNKKATPKAFFNLGGFWFFSSLGQKPQLCVVKLELVGLELTKKTIRKQHGWFFRKHRG